MLRDAIFLDNHQGWSWHDLQATPEPVVEMMRELDHAHARHAAAQAAQRRRR